MVSKLLRLGVRLGVVFSVLLSFKLSSKINRQPPGIFFPVPTPLPPSHGVVCLDSGLFFSDVHIVSYELVGEFHVQLKHNQGPDTRRAPLSAIAMITRGDREKR